MGSNQRSLFWLLFDSFDVLLHDSEMRSDLAKRVVNSIFTQRTITTTAKLSAGSPPTPTPSASTSSSPPPDRQQQQPSRRPRPRTDIPTSFTHLKSLKDYSSFDPILDVHPSHIHTHETSSSLPHPLKIVNITGQDSHEGWKQTKPSSEHMSLVPGEDDSLSHLSAVTHLSPSEINALYRFPLITKRVVNMKSKGKLPSMYSLVVVGNGKGLVGVGEGKDTTASKAVQKAFSLAVRSMDFVERYEERTVWGNMESNFGSCKIQMRSRPPGFGLRVNHYLHQVAKAAGISDLSAKVFGSRNGTRVIKLAVSMLHGGSVPLDMGDSFGKKGQRRNKKVTEGMQTADQVAKARGRQAVSV